MQQIGCALLSLTLLGWGAAHAQSLHKAIPAEPLARALEDFARDTSLQLVYVSELAQDRESPGAPAGLAAEQALARLLQGSGLSFQFLNSHTIRLVEAPPESRSLTRGTHRSTEPAVAAQSSIADTLEEVVVTATKRAESLERLPMSATVFTAERMELSGIGDFAELAALLPGVEYDFSTQWGPGILTNFAIRGISSDKGEATTAIYLDDAPIHAPHTSFSNVYPVTFDLARVEILRGPQGTLFGMSAEGGTVRFISNEASTTQTSGQWRAALGTTDDGAPSFESGVAAGGPLIDGTLGGRISAWYRHEGGYVERIDPLTGTTVDPNANRDTTRAVRASLLLEPSERVRITPSFSYQSVDEHDTPIFYAYLSDPGNDVFRNGKLLRQPAADRFSLESLKLEAELTAFTITLVSSYFDRKASAIVDTTNVAGVVFYGGFGNPLGPAYPTAYDQAVPSALGVHQIGLTHELRFTSTNGDSPLHWVTGLFYTRSRIDATRDTYAIVAPQIPGILTDDYGVSSEVAGFGQADLEFAQRWTASLGLRVSHVVGDGTEHASGIAEVGVAPYSHGRSSSTPVTPAFSLAFQADESNMLYTRIAKGLRSGGANTVQTPCGAPSTFGPDTVWSYEIGSKDRLLDRRLLVDTAVYYVRWNGIQEHLVDPCGQGYTGSAGAARSKGFELNASSLLAERLRLDLSLAYVDVRYTRTVFAFGNETVVDGGTVVGGVPSVPAPWSGTLGAQYQWVLGRGWLGYVRAEDVATSHNTGPFTENDPRMVGYVPSAPFSADPATNRLNFQLGIERASLEVKLALYNSLNAHPQLQTYADAPNSSLLYAYTFRPRTVTLTVSQHF